MADDDRVTVIWPRDSTIVAVNNPLEVEFWCGRFDTTPEELSAAVGAVGNRFKEVSHYLKHKPRGNGAHEGIDRRTQPGR